jgi:chromosome segregation ATPase
MTSHLIPVEDNQLDQQQAKQGTGMGNSSSSSGYSIDAKELADAKEAAAAAASALSVAQGKIEELLDEKADLEYDVDVLERKLELLREEVSHSKSERKQR